MADAAPKDASLSDLNNLSVSSWEANAAFWDDFMGSEGNEFFRILEIPGLLRFVNVQDGDRVLDLATGNGLVARKLAGLGAIVTATDASANMINLAKQRTSATVAEKINYGVLDVTKVEDLDKMIQHASQHGGFDTVTMNMGLMDVPTLEPLAAALPRLLKSKGKFVATVCHPVFFSPGALRLMQLGENQTTGRYETQHSMNITRYLHIPPAKGEALHGQPAIQLYFHRSMGELFRPFFEAGLKLDGLEEPSFTSGPDPKKLQSYNNFPQIPPILIFRMVRAS